MCGKSERKDFSTWGLSDVLCPTQMHKHACPFPPHPSNIWPSVLKLSNAPWPSIWENTKPQSHQSSEATTCCDFGSKDYLEQLYNSTSSHARKHYGSLYRSIFWTDILEHQALFLSSQYKSKWSTISLGSGPQQYGPVCIQSLSAPHPSFMHSLHNCAEKSRVSPRKPNTA